MKISNSKKQLAKIIHENGGWRDWLNGTAFAVQNGDHGYVSFCKYMPMRRGSGGWKCAEGFIGQINAKKLPNWHQTVLSRDEYFHLYPAAKAAPEPVAEAKPAIEQLAADYRSRKDYADRKQQEADAAKADAEAKLAELVAAGKALGLVLSVVGREPEPELVITDWRDLLVGDVVQCVKTCDGKYEGETGTVLIVGEPGPSREPLRVQFDGGAYWVKKWRFIRRPTKGATNA